MRSAVLLFVRNVRLHWKRILLYGVGSTTFLFVVVQLLYPAGQMVPFARVDGVAAGSWQKTDLDWELDRRYLDQRIRIYFGTNQMPYRSPVTGEVGIVVKNNDRIDQISYPWWLRLVPTSIIWVHKLQTVPPPDYEMNEQGLDAYIKKELGQSCNIQPKDAMLKYENAALQVIKSEMGGTCQPNDIKVALEQIRPTLSRDSSVRISMIELPPAVTTETAQQMANVLTERIGAGIAVRADEEVVVIPAEQMMEWLDFSIVEGVLTPQLNNVRAGDFLTKNIAPKVAIPAGVTKVTTVDFVETSRVEGPSGQALHNESTLANILSFLKAERGEVSAVTDLINPRVEYTRSYSPTDEGLSALLANYAKDHSGTFGVAFIELSGKHRRGIYNENKSFVTASTYKLFVAYSTLKRIDAGTWGWDDANIADGRNLAACFDDMIVKSDNACAQSLLKKIGFKTITDEVKAIGLTNTSFTSGDTPHSTAADEALFLAQLESNQLPVSASSRDRLLGAMKRNIYRQGIPAGASGQVANKVGFLWGLLHDASIVYSPSGTYILVVLTDGSSWRSIADLTRQIEALRLK